MQILEHTNGNICTCMLLSEKISTICIFFVVFLVHMQDVFYKSLPQIAMTEHDVIIFFIKKALEIKGNQDNECFPRTFFSATQCVYTPRSNTLSCTTSSQAVQVHTQFFLQEYIPSRICQFTSNSLCWIMLSQKYGYIFFQYYHLLGFMTCISEMRQDIRLSAGKHFRPKKCIL